MNGVIASKFWEMMANTSSSICKECFPNQDLGQMSPSEDSGSGEFRFLTRGRLSSSLGDKSNPPPSPLATGDSPRNHDSVFFEDSPRRNPALIHTRPIAFWHSSRDSSTTSQSRNLSLDDFQLDLYQRLGDTDVTDVEELPEIKANGQLTFNLAYRFDENQLELDIIRATDLPPPSPAPTEAKSSSGGSFRLRDTGLPMSNPYVRVQLLPSKTETVVTAIRRKTQSPTWNEKFVFPMTYKESLKSRVEMMVRDCDKLGRHTTFGRVCVNLADLEIAVGERLTKDIISCDGEPDDIGEILLALQYLPTAGRLSVDVVKARNLTQRDFLKKPDTHVKVNFMEGKRVVKSKWTALQRGTLNPSYNESFHLNVCEENLDRVSIIISVYDRRAASKDDLTGRVILGAGRNSGLDQAGHWGEMIACPRIPVPRWHRLLTKQTCNSVSSVSSVDTNKSC